MSDREKTNQESAKEAKAVAKEKKPKKKRGAGFKVLIVVLVVFGVLAAGGGIVYGVFHNNPYFCNFICHTPMDPYVDSYMENKSVSPYQANSKATLGVVNHREAGITCLDCHNDGLGAQIKEGFAWITGSYTLPLELTIVMGDPKPGERNGEEFCLSSGCHAGISNMADLAAKNVLPRNPHVQPSSQPHLPFDCSGCHQLHEQSVLWCTQCHVELKVPNNWLSQKEANDQKKAAK